MLLAIDAGNTNILFALCDGETILSRWRIATDPHRTADEYAVWLQQLLELQKRELADIDAVMIGTVVPRALHNLQTLARRYCNVEPLVAGDGKASWPMNLDVPEPETLGADRGLNIIAAHAAFDGDIVVIDFGTATTFDICDYTGAYKGGVIAPGINLSLDALTGKTAQLPKIAIEKPDDDSVVGTTTQSQMLIGVYWGYVAMIEGLLERTRKEIGRPVTVVATGGLSALFPEGLFDHIDFDLTIKGLILLHQQATNS